MPRGSAISPSGSVASLCRNAAQPIRYGHPTRHSTRHSTRKKMSRMRATTWTDVRLPDVSDTKERPARTHRLGEAQSNQKGAAGRKPRKGDVMLDNTAALPSAATLLDGLAVHYCVGGGEGPSAAQTDGRGRPDRARYRDCFGEQGGGRRPRQAEPGEGGRGTVGSRRLRKFETPQTKSQTSSPKETSSALGLKLAAEAGLEPRRARI